jgi:hypothetical protein
MGKKKFTAEPQPFMLIVELPESYKGDGEVVMLNEATKEASRERYIKEGNPLRVVKVGTDCTWSKVGDMILTRSGGPIQKFTIDGSEEPFYVLRESDILVRL